MFPENLHPPKEEAKALTPGATHRFLLPSPVAWDPRVGSLLGASSHSPILHCSANA